MNEKPEVTRYFEQVQADYEKKRKHPTPEDMLRMLEGIDWKEGANMTQIQIWLGEHPDINKMLMEHKISCPEIAGLMHMDYIKLKGQTS